MSVQDSKSARTIRPRNSGAKRTRTVVPTLMTVPDLRTPPPTPERRTESQAPESQATESQATESNGPAEHASDASFWQDAKALLSRHGLSQQWQTRLATIGTIAAAIVACTLVARMMRPNAPLPDTLPTVADVEASRAAPASQPAPEMPQFDPAEVFASSNRNVQPMPPITQDEALPPTSLPSDFDHANTQANRAAPYGRPETPFSGQLAERLAPPESDFGQADAGVRSGISPAINPPSQSGPGEQFGSSTVARQQPSPNPFSAPVDAITSQPSRTTPARSPFQQPLSSRVEVAASRLDSADDRFESGGIAQASGMLATDPKRFPTLQQIEESLKEQKRRQQQRVANANSGLPANENFSNRGGVAR